MRYSVEDIANCVDQQASEKSVGVVKSGRAGPGSQSASQDGWVVNVFQQEKPSSRARRAVWSRQLSLAAAPPCSPPKKQPMGINLRAWLAADLKQSACLSLSLPHSSTLTHEMFLSFTLNSLLPFFPFQQIPLLMKMESSFSARANNIIFLEA